MATVAQIWRYPIKSHGREALQAVPLSAGKTLPWDRHWAVAHENSTADGSVWVPCQNFSRGAKAPLLMAINSRWDADRGQMHMRHPDLPDLQFNPDDADDQNRFLEWSAPLMPENRAKSARLIRAAECGLTDTDYPWSALAICHRIAPFHKSLGAICLRCAGVQIFGWMVWPLGKNLIGLAALLKLAKFNLKSANGFSAVWPPQPILKQAGVMQIR